MFILIFFSRELIWLCLRGPRAHHFMRYIQMYKVFYTRTNRNFFKYTPFFK